MKFDIALAFIATTYAMELGSGPVPITLKTIRDTGAAEDGEAAKECIAATVYSLRPARTGELEALEAACDEAVDRNETYGRIAFELASPRTDLLGDHALSCYVADGLVARIWECLHPSTEIEEPSLCEPRGSACDCEDAL